METITTSNGVCTIRRSNRRTLAISALPDGAVEVIAPRAATLADIRVKIERRARWIARQRRFFTALRAERPERRYCTGATHRYLGRQYRLLVAIATEQSVKMRGACIQIAARTDAEKSVAALLDAWMRARAREQFERRLGRWRTWCVERNLPEPRVSLLAMPKRWGSAHKDGRVSLNPELIRAPSICIDYVIAHEMCHMLHPQHDKPFYAELGRQCPGWKTHKRRLESLEL
jgi:predicted metal-dependent hydrolase